MSYSYPIKAYMSKSECKSIFFSPSRTWAVLSSLHAAISSTLAVWRSGCTSRRLVLFVTLSLRANQLPAEFPTKMPPQPIWSLLDRMESLLATRRRRILLLMMWKMREVMGPPVPPACTLLLCTLPVHPLPHLWLIPWRTSCKQIIHLHPPALPLTRLTDLLIFDFAPTRFPPPSDTPPPHRYWPLLTSTRSTDSTRLPFTAQLPFWGSSFSFMLIQNSIAAHMQNTRMHLATASPLSASFIVPWNPTSSYPGFLQFEWIRFEFTIFHFTVVSN